MSISNKAIILASSSTTASPDLSKAYKEACFSTKVPLPHYQSAVIYVLLGCQIRVQLAKGQTSWLD